MNLYYLVNFLECGHFCIKYVLKKEKKKKTCTYNKSMMNLLLIQNVLKEYFSYVVWYKKINIDEIKFRCVSLIKVREKYYHYIVIERVNNEYVFYYDPLFLFIRRVKKEKFIKKWTNIACLYH